MSLLILQRCLKRGLFSWEIYQSLLGEGRRHRKRGFDKKVSTLPSLMTKLCHLIFKDVPIKDLICLCFILPTKCAVRICRDQMYSRCYMFNSEQHPWCPYTHEAFLLGKCQELIYDELVSVASRQNTKENSLWGLQDSGICLSTGGLDTVEPHTVLPTINSGYLSSTSSALLDTQNTS